MIRVIIIIVVCTILPRYISAQNQNEKSIITLVNAYRAKENLPPAKYLADYFGINEYIQSIKNPTDTTEAELIRVVDEFNYYLNLRLESNGIHINYSAGIVPINTKTATTALVAIMRSNSNSESIFYNYSVRHVLPITWSYLVYNKQVLFIYIISFE